MEFAPPPRELGLPGPGQWRQEQKSQALIFLLPHWSVDFASSSPPKLLSSEARQNNGFLNSFKEVERKPWEALLFFFLGLLPVNHSSGLGAGKSSQSKVRRLAF